jgi:hypothetical protein
MLPRPVALMVVTLLAGACLAQYGDIGDLKLARPEDKEDVKSAPPPRGAVVLFDGKSLDAWAGKDGKPARWELLPGGVMQVKGGDIHTREKFAGRFKLHVEFRVPYYPGKKGQGRGNSGVYLQGRYEVQVLDSYGIDKPQMGDCGAIYGVKVPSVNACKAPTVWQSYDVEFTAPKFESGKQVAAGRMTVVHNGVKIHDGVPLVRQEKGKEVFVTNTTAGMGGDPATPGPVMLQDHGDPVQYRNVWLLPVKE